MKLSHGESQNLRTKPGNNSHFPHVASSSGEVADLATGPKHDSKKKASTLVLLFNSALVILEKYRPQEGRGMERGLEAAKVCG